MRGLDVKIALEGLRKDRELWGQRRTEFFSGYDWVLTRLVHEGVKNYLSAPEMAAALGVKPATIRVKMRNIGLNPKDGKRTLSKTASQALLENAELMGVEPSQVDLTSPLAYLPMGEEMRKAYQDKTLARVTELDEDGQDVNEAWVDWAANHILHENERDLKRAFFAGAEAVSGNKPMVEIDADHMTQLESLVERSKGIMPVSVQSLVGMALDAFINGAKSAQ